MKQESDGRIRRNDPAKYRNSPGTRLLMQNGSPVFGLF